ncbi:cupin domain-containing protein [Rhodospirillaceae bacterium KN72]|uniref:Cupin domain-containing protein n=1 Tax=Pacificispira spongiicola TaxID=2729598 RepID=A0A7Y0DX71_9PROT|nr:cupin domain-containing protein [Pacificispira spongiicola]NMM43259.1 cupin domain-containing protein [Pacificispira spongiicola]
MADTPLKPLTATDIAPRLKPSNYPPEFAVKVEGRIKRQLGDAFGLKNFGVNLTVLKPGAMSALHHRHGVQDEFIYILSGHPTVAVDDQEYRMDPGMVMGFPAQGAAHHLRNDTDEDVTYLEIGDRLPGDSGEYPNDDIMAVRENDQWVFKHKDGTPY